jgi:hypothetical protein
VKTKKRKKMVGCGREENPDRKEGTRHNESDTTRKDANEMLFRQSLSFFFLLTIADFPSCQLKVGRNGVGETETTIHHQQQLLFSVAQYSTVYCTVLLVLYCAPCTAQKNSTVPTVLVVTRSTTTRTTTQRIRSIQCDKHHHQQHHQQQQQQQIQ